MVGERDHGTRAHLLNELRVRYVAVFIKKEDRHRHKMEWFGNCSCQQGGVFFFFFFLLFCFCIAEQVVIGLMLHAINYLEDVTLFCCSWNDIAVTWKYTITKLYWYF